MLDPHACLRGILSSKVARKGTSQENVHILTPIEAFYVFRWYASVSIYLPALYLWESIHAISETKQSLINVLV